MEKIQVLKVAPLCEPEIVTITDTLETWQKEVGGYIECCYPFDDPVCIVCNEESKLIGLPPNRMIFDERGRPFDVIYGTFFIIYLLNEEGEDDGGFYSLPPELLQKYKKRYEYIEIFV